MQPGVPGKSFVENNMTVKQAAMTVGLLAIITTLIYSVYINSPNYSILLTLIFIVLAVVARFRNKI